MEFELIDTEQGLEDVVAHVAAAPWIGIDTEFVRERTYFPKLCLIQIAFPDRLVIVDAIAIGDLRSLFHSFQSSDVRCIFHAATQDLEVFWHEAEMLPRLVHDTQLGAAFLGLGEQLGYAALVEMLFSVRLAKTHTRTNWAGRPLSTAALNYAAEDVLFLGEICSRQIEALEKSGKRAWYEEAVTALLQPALYEVAPEQAWRKIKGIRQCRGREWLVVSRLAAWREREAARRNVPRQWLLRDEALLALSRKRTLTRAKVAEFARQSKVRLAPEDLDALISAAATPLAGVDEQQPHADAGPKREPSAAQDALVDALMAWSRQRSMDIEISLNQLATRQQLQQFVLDPVNSELCRGWRSAALGEDLLAFMEGRKALFVDRNRLKFTPR